MGERAKVCPECNSIAFYDGYFGAFMCSGCKNMWSEKHEQKFIVKKNNECTHQSKIHTNKLVLN